MSGFRTFLLTFMLLAPLLCPTVCWSQDKANLLPLVLEPPKRAFKGKKLVTTWYGKRSRATEIRVFFKPPGKWRHEILDAAGKVVKTTIQDGTKEWIVQPGYGVIIERDVKNIRRGSLGRRDLKSLLSDNYVLESLGRREMLGHQATGISLTPKAKVGPRRLLWVDPKSGIVFHRRQSNHRGKLVRESRMVLIELVDDLPDGLFSPPSTSELSIVSEEGRPALKAPQEVAAREFPAKAWQSDLPYGYQLDSVRSISIGEAEILHFRYSNGLSTLSMFVSPHPIDDSDVPSSPLGETEDYDFSAASWAGMVLSWDSKDHYYLLVGDLSRRNLRKIRTFIQTAKNPA